jgi:hypothetical protein
MDVFFLIQCPYGCGARLAHATDRVGGFHTHLNQQPGGNHAPATQCASSIPGLLTNSSDAAGIMRVRTDAAQQNGRSFSASLDYPERGVDEDLSSALHYAFFLRVSEIAKPRH